MRYNNSMKNLNIQDDTGKLFYIGGVVRDELLNRQSFDVDIVFEGDAIEHCSSYGEVIRSNPDFGTVRVNVDGVEVDFASTRSEKYPLKGHLPVVDKIGCSLKEDVLRRDFTVNALAKSVKTGEIVDYVGGLVDIENKILRVLHDESFIDDPTRIIRALKFSVRFGFALEEGTRQLQENYLAHINYDMCYKRIKKELIETFNLNSQEAYERFFNEGIYKLVQSEDIKYVDKNVPQIVELLGLEQTSNLWLVYVGILDLSKLELTKVEMKILNDFVALRDLTLDTDFDIYKAFNLILPETLALYAIHINQEKVERFVNVLRNVKIEINGDDLVKLGYQPSPKFGEIFDEVLRAKLQNPTMTKDDEIVFVKNLLTL